MDQDEMKENVRQLLETVNDLLRNTEEGEEKKLWLMGRFVWRAGQSERRV